MIQINLIPVKEKKKRKEFFIIFWVIIFFVFVVLGMLYIYAQRLAAAEDLNKQIEDVKKESQIYQKEITEFDDLKRNKDSLDAYKKTIQGISEVQRKVLAAIDQAAVNMPNGVWLTRIQQGGGNDNNKYIIQGYAVSIAKMQDYVSNLRRPGSLVKEVTFDEKNMSSSVNKFQLHQFEITFRVADQGT